MSLTTPNKQTGIPLGRIKTIMKSSPDVESISTDALFAMGKSSELFVSHLANQAYENSEINRSKTVEYKHLANVINSEDIFGFLQEIIPHKITVKEYYEILKSDVDGGSGDDSDSTATD